MAGATRASAAARRLVLLVGGGWLLAAGGGAAAAAAQEEELPVDLELVLAVDASGSIDAEEARRQREGYVAAIADEAVARAIRANFHRRIAVLYLEWAGARRQRVVVDWTLIGDAGGAGGFAAALAAAPLSSGHWTSISGAIDF